MGEISGIYIVILLIFIIISIILAVCGIYGRSFMHSRNIESVMTLLGLAQIGDPSLNGHSVAMRYLIATFYDFLPLDYRLGISRNDIIYAALFLDIGKLGIPSNIRNKAGKLTAGERTIMTRYPEVSVELLKDLPGFNKTEKWIRYYRERVDGTGKYKLKGNEIPVASRMLAIVDTYSSITMPRPYKAQSDHEEAISQLSLAAGTQFDEALVKIFCDIPPSRIKTCMDKVEETNKRIIALYQL